MKHTKDIKGYWQQKAAQEGMAPQFELFSNRYLLAEGCYGIMDYDSGSVRINLPHGQLLVQGDALQIEEMDGQMLRITGVIRSMEFVGGIYESLH